MSMSCSKLPNPVYFRYTSCLTGYVNETFVCILLFEFEF